MTSHHSLLLIMQANTNTVSLHPSMFLNSVSTSKNTKFLPIHIWIFIEITMKFWTLGCNLASEHFGLWISCIRNSYLLFVYNFLFQCFMLVRHEAIRLAVAFIQIHSNTAIIISIINPSPYSSASLFQVFHIEVRSICNKQIYMKGTNMYLPLTILLF